MKLIRMPRGNYRIVDVSVADLAKLQLVLLTAGFSELKLEQPYSFKKESQ